MAYSATQALARPQRVPVGLYRTSWDWVIREALSQEAGQNMVIAKTGIPHPMEAGFRQSMGLPCGTLLHYRKALRDGRGIHVREYQDHYHVHWDRRDPSIDPIGHIWEDVPGGPLIIVGGAALLGWQLAKTMSRRSK